MGIYASYFEQAARIWEAYFAGRCTLHERDNELRRLATSYGIQR
jgi:hypothetical protein